MLLCKIKALQISYSTCSFCDFGSLLKRKLPVSTGVSIQIDSPLPQDVTQPVSRGSDVALHNKNPSNLIFYLFCLEFWIALKKETPCFHIRVSIQIDSPLLQGVTQPVSRRSDVALHNKNPPNLIFYLFCLEFWIPLKKETPCFHRPVSIQIDIPLPQGVTQPVTR